MVIDPIFHQRGSDEAQQQPSILPGSIVGHSVLEDYRMPKEALEQMIN
jgi:hypothetical protein